MSQVTLHLPQTLYYQLETLAKHEDVSLTEYILYILAYQTRAAYTVQPVPPEAVAEQRAQFNALLKELGQTTAAEIETGLAHREAVAPEKGLSAETIRRVRQKISAKQSQQS